MRGLVYLVLTMAMLAGRCLVPASPALVLAGCATTSALHREAQAASLVAGPLDELGALIDQKTNDAAEQAIVDKAKREGLTQEWARAELDKARALRAAYQQLRDAYAGDVAAMSELARAWTALVAAARAAGVDTPSALADAFDGGGT